MLDGKTCRVATDIGPQTIRAEHVPLVLWEGVKVGILGGSLLVGLAGWAVLRAGSA